MQIHSHKIYRLIHQFFINHLYNTLDLWFTHSLSTNNCSLESDIKLQQELCLFEKAWNLSLRCGQRCWHNCSRDFARKPTIMVQQWSPLFKMHLLRIWWQKFSCAVSMLSQLTNPPYHHRQPGKAHTFREQLSLFQGWAALPLELHFHVVRSC